MIVRILIAGQYRPDESLAIVSRSKTFDCNLLLLSLMIKLPPRSTTLLPHTSFFSPKVIFCRCHGGNSEF